MPEPTACLSVVMPSYNEAATLETVIHRVLKSPYVQELVVVDDGSSDGSVEIVRGIHDPRIRLFVQPIKKLSTGALWKGVDAGLIDGTVNGVGLAVSGGSSLLRRTQTGSIRTYAFALFAGVVAILGYYLIR